MHTYLRPKSQGRSQHVSGFCCSCHGFLLGTFEIITPGQQNDGYWTNADLVRQFKVVAPIFQAAHENAELVFAFDNSSNHHAKAPGALCVNILNLSDGGSKFKASASGQPAKSTLRDTTWQGAR